MTRALAALRNPWFLSIIGITAISLLIWFAGPKFAFDQQVPLDSPFSRLLAILFCVVVWGLNNLLSRARVGRANKEIAKAVPAAPSNDNSVAQYSQAELDALQGRFSEALATYQKAVGKNGKANLYEMPWYIMIGPPGSGKTTALANSGLRFPLANRHGGDALPGVGGTRNCDWLFTSEAVFIDTAGRYTTQDSQQLVDSAAWKGFLDLLLKYRKRRPINGVILAISLMDILTQSPAERERQILALRDRLQELDTHLGIQFPVYVLFTKCDLLAGFVDYFDDLDDLGYQQIWGMTFPYSQDSPNTSSADHFLVNFDNLVDRLNERLSQRISQERDPGRRVRLFAFPQQLASLRQQLNEFLRAVFSGDRFSNPVLLRGVYFSSATQEGSPIDRVIGALAKSFGIQNKMFSDRARHIRSYFLTDLLKSVVLEESTLAGANTKLEHRRTWLQRIAFLGIAGTIGVAALLWTLSFARNEIYVNKFNKALTDYNLVVADAPSGGDLSFDYVLQRLTGAKRVADVYRRFDEGVPWLMGFGLYQGDKLSGYGRDLYRSELELSLLPAVQARFEDQLLDSRLSTDLRYETLKSYLMLADEKRRDPQLINDWMAIDWQRLYPEQPEIQGQFQTHLAAMLALGFEAPTLNDAVIEEARIYLSSVPVAELQYGRMKRDYLAKDANPFAVKRALGPKGDLVFMAGEADLSSLTHSSLFTVEGYKGYFKKQLTNIANTASNENWILDSAKRTLTEPEIEQLQADILQLYLTDYIAVWERILATLEIKKFSSLTQAADLLGILVAPLSPLRNLLQAVTENTQLSRSLASELVEGSEKLQQSRNRLERLFGAVDANIQVESKPEKKVDEYFAGIHQLVTPAEDGSIVLDKILANVSQLHAQLESSALGLGGDMLALAKGSGMNEIVTRIQVSANSQPPSVRRWLRTISQSGNGLVLAGARQQINAKWRADVLPLCSRSVSGRYPFVANSGEDISLMDFGRLFGNGGLMNQFFNQNIKPFVDMSGSRWTWKQINGQSMAIPVAALAQFKRAEQIRKVYFQSASDSPSVNFSMKPIYLDANVKSIYLDFEGQRFFYRHGPQRSQRAQWPGADSSGLVKLDFEDDSGARLVDTIEGPWALFRLFDRSRIASISPDVVRVTFSHRSRKSTWEVRADSVFNPINNRLTNKFSCPQNL